MNLTQNYNVGPGNVPTIQHNTIWESLQSYPVKCFPPVLRDVISALHFNTQIPVELIGNVALAAASLSCQSHVNVMTPYSDIPEPCSLYLLTIAESGEGKTTINRQIMRPFYDFASKMKQEFEEKLVNYRREYKIWKVRQQALESNLRQAIRKGYSGKREEDEITKHAKQEPSCPLRPDFIYEDTSLKALIEGLSEHPEAGFISDEAITFFKSYLKNNPGFLNKAWDGEIFNYRRADGEIYQVAPCITFSLMAQPSIFMDYIKKQGSVARSSGFLSRFLFSRVNSTIGHRNENVHFELKDEELARLHKRITELLEEKQSCSENQGNAKKTMMLTDEAKSLWRNKWTEIEKKMATGNEWEHIRDIVAKSGANTLRIAAILSYFESGNSVDIDKSIMKCSLKITDWYLNQASQLFYPMSERYQFEQDVRELNTWIKNRFIQNGGFAFPKNDLEKYGPNRLRRLDKLTPVLNQLISQTSLLIIQMASDRILYISHPSNNGDYPLPRGYHFNAQYSIRQDHNNTSGRNYHVDLSDL